MKCVACGNTSLIEGKLTNEDGAIIAFHPKDASWLKRVLAVGRQGVRAFGCPRCQHLQFAVEFSDSDLQHQQFEGEQPSVIERINSETK